MNSPVMLLVVAAILLAAIPVLIYVRHRNKRFLAASVPANGVVVGLRRRMGKSGSVYAPIVRFTAAGGHPVEFTDAVGSNPPGFKVGDRVEVLYHREKNGWARVSSPSQGSDLRELTASGPFTALLVFICLLMAAISVAVYLIRLTK